MEFRLGIGAGSHQLYDPARYTRGDPLVSPKLLLLSSAVPIVLHVVVGAEAGAGAVLTPTSGFGV